MRITDPEAQSVPISEMQPSVRVAAGPRHAPLDGEVRCRGSRRGGRARAQARSEQDPSGHPGPYVLRDYLPGLRYLVTGAAQSAASS